MLRIHIHGQTPQGRQFLQLTLGSRSTAQILKLPDYPQHGGQCYLTHAESETLMGTKAEVGILTQVSVEADLFGVWPCLGVVACGDLDRWTVLDLEFFESWGHANLPG